MQFCSKFNESVHRIQWGVMRRWRLVCQRRPDSIHTVCAACFRPLVAPLVSFFQWSTCFYIESVRNFAPIVIRDSVMNWAKFRYSLP